MYSEYFQQITDFNHNLVGPMREANSIAASTIEKLAQNQMKMLNEFLGISVNHLQKLTSAKRLEEVVSLQTSYIGETAGKCAESASELLDNSLKAFAEYGKLVDQHAKNLADKTKNPFSAVHSGKSGKNAAAA